MGEGGEGGVWARVNGKGRGGEGKGMHRCAPFHKSLMRHRLGYLVASCGGWPASRDFIVFGTITLRLDVNFVVLNPACACYVCMQLSKKISRLCDRFLLNSSSLSSGPMLP
jgi:hypothetical protein